MRYNAWFLKTGYLSIIVSSTSWLNRFSAVVPSCLMAMILSLIPRWFIELFSFKMAMMLGCLKKATTLSLYPMGGGVASIVGVAMGLKGRRWFLELLR